MEVTLCRDTLRLGDVRGHLEVEQHESSPERLIAATRLTKKVCQASDQMRRRRDGGSTAGRLPIMLAGIRSLSVTE